MKENFAFSFFFSDKGKSQDAFFMYVIKKRIHRSELKEKKTRIQIHNSGKIIFEIGEWVNTMVERLYT